MPAAGGDGRGFCWEKRLSSVTGLASGSWKRLCLGSVCLRLAIGSYQFSSRDGRTLLSRGSWRVFGFSQWPQSVTQTQVPAGFSVSRCSGF